MRTAQVIILIVHKKQKSPLLAQACSLCREKIARVASHPLRIYSYNTLKRKKSPVWLHTGFVPYNTLKEKNCQGRLAPVWLHTLKEKKCILIISSTTTSPRASRTTKVAGTPLLPHCAYTLAVGNRSMPKDNRLSSLALLSDAYKPPIAPSIASPLSFSFPEAPRHCP